MGKLEVSGTRIANNALVTPNNLTALSGYVQQDDLFILGLTVREHLCFQAMVRMHCGLSKEEKWERVEEVLDELELRDVQHTLISSATNEVEGISGGEKKRLSFACEVLTSPSLLFCDEPTSGLDSHMASSVIDVMVKFAEQGRTVLTTIHQPSSLIFSKMDQLMLMSEGRTIYLGPASNALLFFNKCGFECPSKYNPADFFIDALAINPADPERSRKKVEKIANKFKESRVGIDLENEIENDLKYLALSEETVSRSPYKASWATQFIALCWRNATNVRRGGWIVLVRVLTNMLTALSFGSLYMGIDSSTLSGAVSINGGLFLLVAVLAFSNIFLTINVFNPEIKIFFREHFSGMYRVDTFYLAKGIIDLPISLVSNIAFLMVFYGLLGLSWAKFPAVLVIVICTVISVSSFATVDIGLALTPMMVMPLMLLGGLFISINALPPYTKPVRFISFFFFAFEALASNQWEDTQGISLHCPKNFSITANITDCGTVDGAELLYQQGLEMGHKWIDSGALLVLAILFQIIGFIGLSIRARKR
ncbi:protein white isoform X2 [Eurytemora carolleeae]|uniref:protein white isoform X2 n=1 Tax=Eurytemora carolleeae TaxID=1294199 RepID=UPI000C79014D|nr:protein white isoform X2 [Eurytemora carolleeae]|eukprot:XP_023346126.1 protein white-like isoform X2 [Eurytemora affinis]